MAFTLNPKSNLLKNTGNFNAVSSPAKFAPLIAAALPALAGVGAAAAAGGAAVAGAGAASGGAAASGLEVSKIMNIAGKSKGKSAKEKTKPKFYTENEDSYYGE